MDRWPSVSLQTNPQTGYQMDAKRKTEIQFGGCSKKRHTLFHLTNTRGRGVEVDTGLKRNQQAVENHAPSLRQILRTGIARGLDWGPCNGRIPKHQLTPQDPPPFPPTAPPHSQRRPSSEDRSQLKGSPVVRIFRGSSQEFRKKWQVG